MILFCSLESSCRVQHTGLDRAQLHKQSLPLSDSCRKRGNKGEGILTCKRAEDFDDTYPFLSCLSSTVLGFWLYSLIYCEDTGGGYTFTNQNVSDELTKQQSPQTSPQFAHTANWSRAEVVECIAKQETGGAQVPAATLHRPVYRRFLLPPGAAHCRGGRGCSR